MDDEVSYPDAKRRRTSHSPSPSRSLSRTPDRSRKETTREAKGYHRSRTSSNSPSRSRSRSPRRSHRRSSSGSSHYATPRRSRSKPCSEYSSRSISPIPRSKRSLHYRSFATIPKAHARGITCARFSPDGALLATASADATINIYAVPASSVPADAGSGQEQVEFKHIRTLRGHLAGVNALAWSHVGNPGLSSGSAAHANSYTLASASDDKDIMLWSPLSSDAPIAPSPLTGHSNYVYSLAFSPKGNMLVSGSYDEALFLWDVRSGRCMRQLPAHSDPVGGVDFVCDGTMVCSCSTDGLIRIWDSGTGQCLRTLVDEDRNGVTSVMFSPNGKFVLAWTLDGCVRLWNYAEGRCVKTYQGHVNREFSLGGAMGSYIWGDGEEAAFVASGSEDGTVVVWDVSSKEVLWRAENAHNNVVLSVDFVRVAERGLLVSVGKDRNVRVWLEDVDEKALRRRRERLTAAAAVKQERAEQEEMAGYAVDEDEDVDAQIRELEAAEGAGAGVGAGADHMEVDGVVPGGNGPHDAHAMQLDGTA